MNKFLTLGFVVIGFTLGLQAMSRPGEPPAPVIREVQLAAQYGKLRQFWQGELRRDPHNFTAVAQLAGIYLSQARAMGSSEAARRALELLEQHEALFPRDDVSRLLLLGQAKMYFHRFAEAQELAENVTRVAGKAAESKEIRAAEFLRLDAMIGAGRYEEAFPAVEKLVQGRKNYSALVRLADLAERRGDYDKATSYLEQARPIYEGSLAEPAAWLELRIGVINLHRERLDDALHYFQRALAAAPDYYLALEHIAEVHEIRGELTQAKGYLDRAIEISRRPELLLRRAAIHRAEGEAVRADELSREALAALANNAERDPLAYGRDYAEVLIGRGEDLERARELMKIDLENRPGDLKSNYLAAVVAQRSGDLQTAQRLIAHAVRIGTPDPEWLQLAAQLNSTRAGGAAVDGNS